MRQAAALLLAGAGIALGDHLRARGPDLGPIHDIDPGLVDEGDGDGPVVGAPPVAGVAVHLLLGDELGRPPALQLGPALGQRALGLQQNRQDHDAWPRHAGTGRAYGLFGRIVLVCFHGGFLSNASIKA